MFRNSVIRLFWWPLFFFGRRFLGWDFCFVFFFLLFPVDKEKKNVRWWSGRDRRCATEGPERIVLSHPVTPRLYRVLPGFTEFYRVLPSFTELLSRAATRKSDGTNRRWRLSTGWISFFLQGFTGFYLVLIFFKKNKTKSLFSFGGWPRLQSTFDSISLPVFCFQAISGFRKPFLSNWINFQRLDWVSPCYFVPFFFADDEAIGALHCRAEATPWNESQSRRLHSWILFFWFFVRVLLDFYFSFFCFCYHPNQKKNGNHETIVPFFSPDDKTFCVFFCFLFCALLFFVWNDLSWWSYFFKRHQSTTVFYRVTTEMRPWLFWHAPLRLFYYFFFWGRMFSIVPLNLSLNRQLHKDIGLEYQSFKEKEVLGLAVPTWRSDFARKEIRSIPKVFLFVFFLETELEYRSLSILIALQQ